MASHSAQLSLSNYHGDAAQLNLVKIHSAVCKLLRRTAMDAGADDMLVSRIMLASFTLEIERSAEACAVGYGDLRPFVRDGVWQ